MPEVDAVQSRIEQVTVFASGARIRRVATVKAPLPNRVRIVDLPLAVIDDTVRAAVTGGAIATAIRAGLTTPAGGGASEETPDLRAARVRQEIAKSEVQRLELSLDRLVHAKVMVEDPSEEAPAAWGAVLAARRALVSFRAERQLALRQQQAAAKHELEEAQRALDVASERDHRSGTSRAAKAHEQRKHVELDLTAQEGAGDVTIHIEYQVAAARWAPNYVARLEGEGARFELRAVVAQNSGEDWTGVALQLSTAEPDQFAVLPELHPQKIGRRQAEPAKRGFRAPPAGAETLYADYKLRFPDQGSTRSGMVVGSGYPVGPADVALGAPPSGEVWDEDSSRSKDAYEEQSADMPYPPSAMPVAAKSMARGGKGGGLAGAIAGGIAGAAAAPFMLAQQAVSKRRSAPEGSAAANMRPEPAPSTPTPRLDYGNLRMQGPESAQRGLLVPAPPPDDTGASHRVAEAIAVILRLPLPPGHHASWVHTYDYAFASDGTVDVKSDGAWQSLALTARAGTAKIHHVAVPREQDDVFRVATITNPFDGPLLPGPIDVYDRGQFLLTSEVDSTPPGGSVDVGLGVDPLIKIARNAEFHEEVAGMLRGALKLFHTITVDVENLSPRAIDLEVRERVPVTREGDDDIKVKLAKIDPAWERWTPDADTPQHARLRGTYRWRVEVAPRAKKQLRAGYEVEIAGKNELVGGNRREP